MTRSTTQLPTQPFDLATTYLHLRDGGRTDEIAVDESFWSSIHERADLHEGRLMCVFPTEASWSVWEMHPEGDELVYLLSGSATFVLDDGRDEQRIPVTAPGGVVVPRGIWHTADVHEPGTLLTVTPGKGTSHRPR